MNIKDVIIRIGYYRTKNNLSARELSRRIGNDQSYITRLESAEFNLTVQKLLDILQELNVSPSEFFAENYSTYKEDKNLEQCFANLSLEDKNILKNIIDRMQK